MACPHPTRVHTLNVSTLYTCPLSTILTHDDVFTLYGYSTRVHTLHVLQRKYHVKLKDTPHMFKLYTCPLSRILTHDGVSTLGPPPPPGELW